MGNYFYLGAQLPYLIYGQNPPMSSAAFKTLARDQMGASDAWELDYCTLDPAAETDTDAASPKAHCKMIKYWKEWENTLRLNIAKGRAQKLKRDGEILTDVPDDPVDAAAAAKAALAMESPLEAEIFLDKARWDTIEEYQGTDVFSKNAMYAYLLKLLLMERRMAFNTEEGDSEYKALYAAILGESK